MGTAVKGRLQFHVLGPLEAVQGGRPVRLGGQRQRALLALFLLRANELVRTETLVEELFGGEVSDRGANALQVAVSRLRRVLGIGDGSTLVTRPGGYVLQVDAAQLDAARFERLVAEARGLLAADETDSAAARLREALGLWRGAALADLALVDVVQPEIRRLEELRLCAVEARIEADLRLGRHAELIAELETLAARHPTREQIAGQLMLALYRCGRQADALEVYQRTRTQLAEELGLEPDPQLRALQMQILEQSPSLRAIRRSDQNAKTSQLWPADAQARNRSNLPTPAQRLVGREAEKELTLKMLGRQDVRLVTLLGPGGVGKTRLAIEVAAEAIGDYRDGVWIVPLALISESSLMVSEVARVLDVTPVGGQAIEETLAKTLVERELLLVLDNFEHLMEAAGAVANLLEAAPHIDVLATSREPLRIRSEHRVELPSLAVADANELFLQRAVAVRPELTVDDEDRAAIEQICLRLDCLPLAMELAASRISVFGPRALEARLADRLELPEGPRDLPKRQRTLRATIDWSYQLLAPPERRLFVSLSPFVGGVRMDSAESIWGAEVIDGLTSLTEKSLLRRREDPDREPRFSMLETQGRRVHTLGVIRGRRGPPRDAAGMTGSQLLDAAGRRRSPATIPGFHCGRPPRNKGRSYPADPTHGRGDRRRDALRRRSDLATAPGR